MDVSADMVRQEAEHVIRMHEEPPSSSRRTGVCAKCEPGGGCPLLAWALAVQEEGDPR